MSDRRRHQVADFTRAVAHFARGERLDLGFNDFHDGVFDGRARLCPVKTGRFSPTEAQVLDGLKEGEAVILYPGDRVRDGQRVKVIKI